MQVFALTNVAVEQLCKVKWNRNTLLICRITHAFKTALCNQRSSAFYLYGCFGSIKMSLKCHHMSQASSPLSLKMCCESCSVCNMAWLQDPTIQELFVSICSNKYALMVPSVFCLQVLSYSVISIRNVSLFLWQTCCWFARKNSLFNILLCCTIWYRHL